MVNIEKIVLKKKQLEEENKLLKNRVEYLEKEVKRLTERIKDAKRVLGFGSTGLVFRKRRTKSN